MIVQILSIQGEGFMSFQDTFLFSLNWFEGKMLQIDGMNKDDEKSTSNGSGKSTLLEMINWGLYGKLCRKSRYKDEAINKSSKKAVVQITFAKNQSNYKIMREIHRKREPQLHVFKDEEELFKDATYQTKQDELERILGTNFTAFQCSVMFGKDFMNFPDLKPADRAKVLTEIRNLHRYIEANKRAADLAKSTEETTRDRKEELAIEESKILALRAIPYKTDIENFEKDRKENVKKIEADILKTEQELNEYKDKVEQATNRVKTEVQSIEDSVKVMKEEIGDKEPINRELEAAKVSISSLILQNETTHRLLLSKEKEKHKLLDHGTGICPFCSQEITGEVLIKRRVELDTEIDTLKESMRVASASIGNGSEIVKELEKRVQEIKQTEYDIVTNEREVDKLKMSLPNLLEAPRLGTLRERLRNLSKRLKDVWDEPNPYLDMEESRKQRIREIGAVVRQIQVGILDLEQTQKYYSVWAEGFKKIRLMIFETMINHLESLINYNMSQYSSELSVVLATERETRSGTIKDEFGISVIDQDGREISYEMYSGGERQKIRLSIALALAQFIRDSCGIDYNFIAFDEPNEALDDSGKDANFEAFLNLSRTHGKAVLVTDHDSSFKDRFDHSLMVVKENGKSQILQEV